MFKIRLSPYLFTKKEMATLDKARGTPNYRKVRSRVRQERGRRLQQACLKAKLKSYGLWNEDNKKNEKIVVVRINTGCQ